MQVTLPFKSGNSQAVRLPKSLAFPSNTPVVVRKENDTVIIEPVRTLEAVPQLFAQLGTMQRIELEENERQW